MLFIRLGPHGCVAHCPDLPAFSSEILFPSAHYIAQYSTANNRNLLDVSSLQKYQTEIVVLYRDGGSGPTCPVAVSVVGERWMPPINSEIRICGVLEILQGFRKLAVITWDCNLVVMPETLIFLNRRDVFKWIKMRSADPDLP